MKKNFTFVDIILIVIGAFSVIVASPYVIRQFAVLSKPGDYIWNISFDIVVAAVCILLLYIIDRLLNRYL